MHEHEHEGRTVIVIGAAAGDTLSPQVWLDREHLYNVRIIVPTQAGRRVTDIAQHVFMGGGWIEQEIRIYVNGALTLLEDIMIRA